MWVGEGERSVQQWVDFSEAFAEPPSVIVHVSLWDFKKSLLCGLIFGPKISRKKALISYLKRGVIRVSLGYASIGRRLDKQENATVTVRLLEAIEA